MWLKYDLSAQNFCGSWMHVIIQNKCIFLRLLKLLIMDKWRNIQGKNPTFCKPPPFFLVSKLEFECVIFQNFSRDVFVL